MFKRWNTRVTLHHQSRNYESRRVIDSQSAGLLVVVKSRGDRSHYEVLYWDPWLLFPLIQASFHMPVP